MVNPVAGFLERWEPVTRWLLRASGPSLHHPGESDPFLLLRRGRTGKQEALPLGGQIAQGHGWSKYPPGRGSLDNQIIYTTLLYLIHIWGSIHLLQSHLTLKLTPNRFFFFLLKKQSKFRDIK